MEAPEGLVTWLDVAVAALPYALVLVGAFFAGYQRGRRIQAQDDHKMMARALVFARDGGWVSIAQCPREPGGWYELVDMTSDHPHTINGYWELPIDDVRDEAGWECPDVSGPFTPTHYREPVFPRRS